MIAPLKAALIAEDGIWMLKRWELKHVRGFAAVLVVYSNEMEVLFLKSGGESTVVEIGRSDWRKSMETAYRVCIYTTVNRTCMS